MHFALALLFAAAQLKHAYTLLWSGDYAAAQAEFRALLARNPRDDDARFGLAEAEYWSGDYRAAARDFRLSHRAEARKALRDIEAASRPGWSAGGDALSDDQPYHAAATSIGAYVYADPLTTFGIDGETTRGTAHTNALRVWGATTFPPISLRLAATEMTFPDDVRKLLPLMRVETKTLAFQAQREPLIRTLASTRTHATADSYSIRWHRGDDAAVEAEHLRYFDGNRGNGADAWLLHPIGAVMKAGASVAWRDTAESRFVNGIFDPYYTPQNLREVRAIVAASRAGFTLHLDGGAGREATVGSYHPWRVSGSYAFRNIIISAERSSTAFYTSNEIRASVAGRF